MSEPTAPDAEGSAALTPRQTAVFVISIFVAGLCSIVYELLIGTTSSYFLGDSITQFSITIGLFMAAMGLGSFISRATGSDVMRQFVLVEVLLGVVGGASVPVLYLIYAYTDLYQPAMMVIISVVGVLTGLEIPLLARALKRHYTFEVNLSNVLSLDYLGALAATLLFPFVLLPMLGTFKSALVVGLLNLVIAALVIRVFRGQIEARRRHRLQVVLALCVVSLGGLLGFADHLLKPWHNALYEDRVVLVRQTPYQKVVMTRGRDDVRLFLNGHLQFSTIDEYRYHEALVHPAMAAARPERVLVLGGGDGLAVREILKHGAVEHIDLVDLDPAITELARRHPLFLKANENSLSDPRVHVHHEDAFAYLDARPDRYDVIIADLPDPNSASLARLYSREFYRLIKQHLAPGGALVTQATSPFFAREAFWCVVKTLSAAGFETQPYHVQVPSFGEWGFVMATRSPIAPERLSVAGVPTRFLEDALLPRLFFFEKDLRLESVSPSTLDQPQVLSYYLSGWKHWN